MSTNHTPGRLLIDIVPSAIADRFDVLLNGFSYRIHRGLTDAEAVKRAAECKRIARAQGQRAAIAVAAGGATT